MKKFLLYFGIFTVIASVALPLLPVNGESGIYGNTLRLHVLANSDSESDQALKLEIRDIVTEYAKSVFKTQKTKSEAEKVYRDSLEEIRQICLSALIERGYGYDVGVTLGEEYFDTREYGDLRYPAGYYTSLTVRIGEGKGKNWWCVLFPPLCLGTSKKEDEFEEAGFTKDQIRILEGDAEPKYVIRFRILEWFESLFGSFD